MGITVISRVTEQSITDTSDHLYLRSMREDNIKTVGDVSKIGKHYRHPDSTLVSYAESVEKPLGNFPEGQDYNIAIIGGGPSGIAALHELSRIARHPKSGKINVTLYEPDPNHFTHCFDPERSSINIYGKRAGRVFAARSSSVSEKKDHSVYEIGAMRFPEIAGLTWHYAKTVFGDKEEIKEFPNPGKVSTEFVFGHRVDRYVGNLWLDDNSPTKAIVKVVADGISGNKDGEDISQYPIGCKDPAKVSDELKGENTSPERLKEIQQQWKEFINEYDGITLESAVRRIIKEKVKDLPPIEGIEKEDEKINYYVELFGCFGFGTGGFKSIFSMSLVEMMRLVLWNYSAEYMLPVKENIEFISKIFEKSCIDNKNFLVKVERARVCDVCHSGNSKKALVFSYEIKNKEEGHTPIEKNYDFVILAIPPQQLSAIISRSGFNNTPRNIKFGDYGRQTTNEISARPPLVLSNLYEAPNTKIVTAINQLHMIGSSKVFGTIEAKIFNEIAPDFNKQKVKAIVSDCGLASSYVVPSPLRESGKGAPSEEPGYYSFLISYTWEDDTKRLQHKFKTYPINLDNLYAFESKNHEKMINSIINHSTRDIKDPINNNYKRWWFGKLLAKDDTIKNLTETLSYDWTTSHAAGAFKLDMTGGHYNSNLCFRYHTHALNTTLNNRFFLASDSYSHLGGWLEGAFMSAVNAVSGIIVAANGGEKEGLKALTTKARAIIESLERIVLPGSV